MFVATELIFCLFRCCFLPLKLSFGPTFFQWHGHGFQSPSTSSTFPLKLGPVLKKSSLGPRHQCSHLPRRTFTKASTTASTGHKRGGHYNTSEGTRGVLDGYARKQEQ